MRALINSPRWNRIIRRVELGPPVNFGQKTSPAPPTPGPTPVTVAPPTSISEHRHRGSRVKAAIHQAIDWIRSWFGGSRSAETSKGGAPTPPAPTPPPSSDLPCRPVRQVHRGNPGSPAWGPPPPTPPPGSSGGSGAGGGPASQIARVVIAVIDQGIAFANSRFFTGVSPRIEYLWQQKPDLRQYQLPR